MKSWIERLKQKLMKKQSWIQSWKMKEIQRLKLMKMQSWILRLRQMQN
jgi:hypothetical protein